MQATQVDLGERGVAFAREDQRQRDGAVEQIRATRLAGALDGAGDVEHVVEDLESQPDPPGEEAERVREVRRTAPRRAVAARPPAVLPRPKPPRRRARPDRQAASNSAAVFSSQRRR